MLIVFQAHLGMVTECAPRFARSLFSWIMDLHSWKYSYPLNQVSVQIHCSVDVGSKVAAFLEFMYASGVINEIICIICLRGH